MAETQITIPVFGMKCQKCAARVTGLIKGFLNVAAVDVSLSEQQAKVNLDSTDDKTVAQIRSALEEAGFRTTPPEADSDPSIAEPQSGSIPQTKTLRFAIQGMSCASCAATIEKRLQQQNGIAQVMVNLAGNFGQVEYDPTALDPEAVYTAVDDAGFKAVPAGQQLSTDRQSQRELVNLLIATACAVSIMLLMFFPLFGAQTILVIALLATISQFTAGLDFYRSGWKSLKNRAANMDVLVSLGITAAYGYSVLAVFGWLGPAATVFFETSAMLIMFIRFGKWLEARAKGKAGEALTKLLHLQADRAVVLVDGQTREVPASEVQPGDLLVVKAGEKIPVDGEVVEGTAAVDEAMISGESVPVNKVPGSEVTGATISRNGRLVIRATRVGEETVLAQIVRLVESAQGDKAPIQRIADRVSNYFVPAVVLLSLLTFCGWYLLTEIGFLFSFQVAIAVVVIACPCALGLATPTAIMVGSSVGLERGILFKRASVLEQISKLQVLLLDKTGTLTSGEFRVNEVVCCAEMNERDVLQLAASLEENSQHPLAKSIVAEASRRGLSWSAVKETEEIGGQGITAKISGEVVRCGQRQLLSAAGVELAAEQEHSQRLAAAGNSLVFLARGPRLLAIIALQDVLKQNAAQAVRNLQKLGLRCVLLTGDRREAADAVGKQLAIEQVEAEVRPEQKQDVVRKYQQQELLVGMVGDGINDAPALAQADIGIAIGSGTDVAKETGDLILVGDDLFDIERGIVLGRRTLRKIKQNLFWAFFYNLLGIPLAAGLFYLPYGLVLKPEFAGLAMAFSSISVVANSLLLGKINNRLEVVGQ